MTAPIPRTVRTSDCSIPCLYVRVTAPIFWTVRTSDCPRPRTVRTSDCPHPRTVRARGRSLPDCSYPEPFVPGLFVPVTIHLRTVRTRYRSHINYSYPGRSSPHCSYQGLFASGPFSPGVLVPPQFALGLFVPSAGHSHPIHGCPVDSQHQMLFKHVFITL